MPLPKIYVFVLHEYHPLYALTEENTRLKNKIEEIYHVSTTEMESQ